jgi:UDP-glucose 4-epimerase
VLDNFSSGSLANLHAVRNQVELIFGDLSSLDTVKDASKGADLVFHLANPDLGQIPGNLSRSSWEKGTMHVLIAAHEAGVRRLVYASSAWVYPSSLTPRNEDDPTQAQTTYGIAKLAGEQQCLVFTKSYGLETVRLRLFNVYGPRQCSSYYSLHIRSLIKAMVLGKNPVIRGDGSQIQDLIYVRDAVHALMLAATTARVSGKVFNIGRGRPTSILEIVARLNSLLGTQLQPFHTSLDLEEELCYRLADSARAEAELGFCPGTDLEQGLRHCLDYYSSWRQDFLDMSQYSHGRA